MQYQNFEDNNFYLYKTNKGNCIFYNLCKYIKSNAQHELTPYSYENVQLIYLSLLLRLILKDLVKVVEVYVSVDPSVDPSIHYYYNFTS